MADEDSGRQRESQLWNPADLNMSWFHRLISKRLWFLLFNVCTVAYLIGTGRLRWELVSVLICAGALLLMNGIALISARNFPDWK